MDMSRKLAEFVANTSYEDIPAAVIETQKKSILDQLAITLGAATLGDGCQTCVALAEENAAGGRGEASVIGFDKKLPAIWAAYANASMAHSLDFGDTQMDAVVHSNASTFPTALAAAEKKGGISGKELLTALVIGSEVACRVSLGSNEDLEKYGFYMPTIYTSYGATAAACKILGLNADQIVDAFSFNLCQTTCSSELMNNSHTVVRSIREGFAARNAILSAQMAQKGLKGFEQPFEGKLGFYHAFARDNCDLDRATRDLGKKFYAGSLYFKLWPSCAGTHPAILSVRKLVEENGINPADIQKVHVVTSQRNRMLMEPEEIRKAPTSSIIGKFSIPYTASVAAIRGDVTLGDFLPESFQDREVLELASKFTYSVNEEWGKEAGMNTDVTITTAKGTYHHFYTEIGVPPKDATFEELAAKLKACAKHAILPKAENQLEGIIAAVQALDSCLDISTFVELL